jgi:cupin 2 domain-containing protein
VPNLFRDIPGRAAEEFVERLAEGPGARVERIVSRGHRSPEGAWYDQDEHEWVVLLSGSGELEMADGRRIPMEPGDHVFLAAHQKHRVVRTDPGVETVWLAVFLTPPL